MHFNSAPFIVQFIGYLAILDTCGGQFVGAISYNELSGYVLQLLEKDSKQSTFPVKALYQKTKLSRLVTDILFPIETVNELFFPRSFAVLVE